MCVCVCVCVCVCDDCYDEHFPLPHTLPLPLPLSLLLLSQGHIWRVGYAEGKLKGEFFSDVLTALAQWTAAGSRVSGKKCYIMLLTCWQEPFMVASPVIFALPWRSGLLGEGWRAALSGCSAAS